MSKSFRSWDVDQGWLLPPSVHDFVPAGHLAHFVQDTVREGLDLVGDLWDVHGGAWHPPYHPGMMVALLLYGYSRGGVRLAAAGAGLRGMGGLHGGERSEQAGLPHDQRVPPAASCGAVGAVRAGAAAVPVGGACDAGSCGGGRDQAEGQRQPA